MADPTGSTTTAPPPAGGPSPPAEAAPPEKIIAKKGQFFCEFAADKGFRNCEKWRAANPPFADKPTLEEGDEVTVPKKEEGETADKDKAKVESVRVDFPPALVRFIGQSTPEGDRTKAGLDRLGISNYVTDKAGLNDSGHTRGFFADYGADDTAGRNANPDEVTTWNDPDHFRLEVHDVSAGKKSLAEVKLELQVLQPLYKRIDKDGKTLVTRDEDGRPDPNAPKGFRIPGNTDRQLLVALKRVGTTNYYRSKYLRLVTETGDKIAGQTLWVGDYYQDPQVGAAAPPSAFSVTTGGGGPSAGAIAGGAIAGAVVAGGVAALIVTQTDNKLSGGEKAAIIGGAAVAGAVAGGLIGKEASDKGPAVTTSPGGAAPPAAAMSPQETEDTRRYGEILQQKVRARYIPAMCTDQKCRAEAFAEVGELKSETRLALHIIDGCCSFEDVRRVVYGQVRRVYAAVGIRPHVKKVFKHGILDHIILIGAQAGTGVRALGNTGVAGAGGAAAPASKVKYKVGGVELVHNLTAGQTVSAAASAISSALEAHRSGGAQVFWTRIIKRDTEGALAAGEEGSNYILVYKDDKKTQFSKVERVSSDDKDFSAGNPSMNSADLGRVTHDSDKHEHILLKASCRTEWFDGILIKDFDTSGGDILYGIATWVFKKKHFPPAFIVHSPRMTEAPNDTRYTFAHEMGHVIMNCGHVTTADNGEQMMAKGDLTVGNAYDMPGRRRIMDKPMKVPYQVAKADGTWLGTDAGGFLSTLDGSSADLATTGDRCHQFMSGVLDSFGGATDRQPDVEW